MEAVLRGSKAALPGLIEMLEVSTGDTVLLTKANTIITVEGSRLQPGEAPATRRSLVIESNLTNGRTTGKNPNRGVGGPFIIKGHMTNAHAVL